MSHQDRRSNQSVDRSLLDLTEGLEKMLEKSEHTNIALLSILAHEEGGNLLITNLLTEGNQIVRDTNSAAQRLANQAEGYSIVHQRERVDQAEAAQIAQDTRAAQAADLAEVTDLLRALFGDIVAAKLWVGRKVRGLFGWFWGMGIPFWVAFFLVCLMLGIKFYEMHGAGVNTSTGGPETTDDIETILAGNPNWKKLLEEPRPLLENLSILNK